MSAVNYSAATRRWEPVRDTSNPSRDPLARGRTGFVALDLQRDKSLRGRPLAQLRMIEAAIRCDVAARTAVQAWRSVA